MEIKQPKENYFVYRKAQTITRDVIRGIRQAYYKIGKDLKAYASEKLLEKPKHGRTYYYYRKKVSKKTGKTSYARLIHIASAPDEFPANWTGKLRKSIGYLVRGAEQLEFGAATEYASKLELSGRTFLRRSIVERQGVAVEHFQNEIKKTLESHG